MSQEIKEIASEIANKILVEMGGDAHEICCGDCTTFAKKMQTELKCKGIESVIIDRLSESAMSEELDGFIIEKRSVRKKIAHCYIATLDEYGNEYSYHDAFDIDGVLNEDDLTYVAQF